ncbi:phage integrase SAM-like domain-containing protein [Larkinella harenae]
METAFLDYFRQRVDAMQNGTILIKRTGKRYSTRTRDSYWTALKWLTAYQRSTQVVFPSDMDEAWFDIFKGYLTRQELRHNTICTCINRIKSILRAQCKADKIPFPADEVQIAEELTTKVYNTVEELKQLEAVELNNRALERVRDGYLIQSDTGLRYSDLRRVLAQASNYIHEVDQRKFFRVRMQKTGDEVVIPISGRAQKILSQRKWKLQLPSIQYFNRHIKAIAEAAKLTENVVVNFTKLGKLQHEEKKKCELMSSHTARRSFATNAFLAGLPAMKIRRITGHRTEESFLRYIRANGLESAITISDHPFFR